MVTLLPKTPTMQGGDFLHPNLKMRYLHCNPKLPHQRLSNLKKISSKLTFVEAAHQKKKKKIASRASPNSFNSTITCYTNCSRLQHLFSDIISFGCFHKNSSKTPKRYE